MKIIAYLHTHWDREWYRTFEEFRFRFFEVFDDIVKKLECGDFVQFYLDGQTILIDDLLEISPEKKNLIKKLIEQKKLVIGPWYTLADEFLVSGECLIRNLFLGIKRAKEFGVEDFTGYLPDAFGHTAGMVDILSSFGIKNSVLWRGCGDKKSEFLWVSKSGAKLTVTHLLEGYFQDFFSHPNSTENIKKLIDKIKPNNVGDLILLPIGADHLGACDDLPQKIADFNSQSSDNLEVGSVFDYLKSSKDNLEEHHGELRDNSRSFILPGTYSTRNYLKRLNTLTAWELKKLESFAGLLSVYAEQSPNKGFLDYAWKLLLQNHAHDSICGCSVDSVHTEMELRFEKINQLLATIKDKALTSLDDEAISFVAKTPVVFNSSGFEYSGMVELKTPLKLRAEDGFELVSKERDFPQSIIQNIHKIPVSEDLTDIYTYLASVKNIPALGFAPIASGCGTDLKLTQNSIENSCMKVIIEKDGTLTIEDKKKNKAYKNALNFVDRADVGDTYNFSPVLGDIPIKAAFAKSKIVFSGFTRGILEIEHSIAIPKDSQKSGRTKSKIGHKIKTQLILDADSPTLKFKTTFQNKSKNHILQAIFAMPEKVTKTASEDSIGLIERDFDPDYDLQKIPFAAEFQELKTNTAPMQRFVWSQGIGILTKGIHEYEVAQNELGITLLRSVEMLSGKKLHTRFNAAGPTIPTDEAQCLRDLTCEYALHFCDEPKELFKAADSYFDPIVAFIAAKVPDSSLCLSNPNIYLLACKEAENRSGIVLRLLNFSSEAQNTGITGLPVTSEEIPTAQNPEPIVLKPYELKSVLVYLNSSK